MSTNYNAVIKLEPERPCKKCKGTGTHDHHWHWDAVAMHGHHGPGPCDNCNATGRVAKPDFDAIFLTVTKGKKGEDKRSFRNSKPKFENEFKNPAEGRAYYVWRMARFHGGADVTMPVIASMCCNYDPYERELDAFASHIAKAAFGTDMAAAYRWANALGGSVPVPADQPATAFACGPVTDGNKPLAEQPELF
jgi:hypothetical protein